MAPAGTGEAGSGRVAAQSLVAARVVLAAAFGRAGHSPRSYALYLSYSTFLLICWRLTFLYCRVCTTRFRGAGINIFLLLVYHGSLNDGKRLHPYRVAVLNWACDALGGGRYMRQGGRTRQTRFPATLP